MQQSAASKPTDRSDFVARPLGERHLLASGILAASLGLLTFGVLIVTGEDMGWTWDEAYYFMSSELQIAWFKAVYNALRAGNLDVVLSQKVIDEYWLWNLYHNPHPPLYRMLSGLGWFAFQDTLGDMRAYRLATAMQAAVLISLLFIVIRRRFGILAGLYGSLPLLLCPLFFGHANLAATEIPLAMFWLLACWAFWQGRDHAWGSLLAGIFWGAALAVKFTAVLIPVPLLLWSMLYKDKRAVRSLACAAVLGPLIAIALNPGWWYQPLDKIVHFLSISLSRKETIPITTFFLGKIYHFSPPWYYCPVMLMITTPVTFLSSMLLGLICFCKQRLRTKYDTLFLLNVPWICGVVMLPNAPVHDGIRQFFAVLPFLAYAASAGFWLLGEWLKAVPLPGAAKKMLLPAFLAGLVLLSAYQLRGYHPYELSYYNELIGGLRGAAARGMEVTYWYDVAGRPLLEAMRAHIPKGSRVSSWPNVGYFTFLQERGLLSSDYVFIKPDMRLTVKRRGMAIEFSEKPDYLVLLSRRGYFNMLYRAISTACTPVYRLAFHDVPLIAIYRWQDVIEQLSGCDLQPLLSP